MLPQKTTIATWSKQLVNTGIYLFLLALPWQTHLVIREASHTFDGMYLYGFDLLLLILLVTWLIYWHHHPSLQPNWTPLIVGLSLVTLTVASGYFANDQNLALSVWLTLTGGILLIGVVASAKLNTTMLLRALLWNGLVQSIAATWQFTTQFVSANRWLGVAQQFPELSGVSVVATQTGRWLRAYAFLPHPNITAGLIVLGLIAAAWLAHQTSKRYQLLYLVGGMVLTSGLFVTFSRTALLVWLIMLMVLTIAKKIPVSWLLSQLALMIILVMIYWPLVSSRLSGTEYIEQLSITDRQTQWQDYTATFIERWPFGVGPGQYAATAAQPIHNVTMALVIDLGVFSALLWFVLIFYPIFKLGVNIQHHPASYLLLGILGLGMADHYFWTIPSFFLLWCLIIGWLYIPQHHPKVAEAASDNK